MAKQRGLLTFQAEELRELERSMRKFASGAQPFAIRGTMNRAAFNARREWQKQIKQRMTVRAKGKFGAPSSILVERASRALPRSIVGSIAPYMADQEFGGTTTGPWPTSQSSGEGDTAFPRRRVPRSRRQLRNIQLARRGGVTQRRHGKGALSRNMRAFIKVKAAQAAGREFVYLDLGGDAEGIYRVSRKNIKLMHRTGNPTRQIPRRPTLAPTLEQVVPRMPTIYRRELKKQLTRRGIKWKLT